uniref:Uncharacterized protein n=1 Tax=Tanacetum cinerariifolium TaxID=118510 RepID=A0A699J732_TANCI|nr:hypothetical protein [Tanacetum cinerariifolium]
MSRDVLTVGSTMRILLLYQGEYSQWVERFMNYLKEQTDGEAMINSIKNGRSLCFVLEMRNNVTPPDTYSIQAPSGGVTDWYQEPRLWPLQLFRSHRSFEDSMGTPAGRVILFGTIPTTIPDTTPMITPHTTETPIITPTIPPSLDYTPASPDYSPTSEAESDPSEDPVSGP